MDCRVASSTGRSEFIAVIELEGGVVYRLPLVSTDYLKAVEELKGIEMVRGAVKAEVVLDNYEFEIFF